MRIRRLFTALITLFATFAAVTALAAEPDCPPAPTQPTPAQIEASVRNARDRGALWTIEKDGRRSWLYGTVHVGTFETAFPGRTVVQALRAAETIAIELDITDQATGAAIRAPQAPAEAPTIPPALLERLKAQARKACVPWERVATMPPSLIVTTLTILAARWDGYDAGYATEIVLVGAARAMGKPLRSLESVAIQRKVLTGGSHEAQIKFIDASVTALEQDRVRPVVKALAKAWAEGDLGTLESYEQWCGCTATPQDRADFERMVFDRNPDIAAAVDALHVEGKRVFAATGIMHMVGDRSLPKLLEKLGYRVERVSFDGN